MAMRDSQDAKVWVTNPHCERGPEGPEGPQGLKGCPGEKGERGDTGPAGPQGDKGDRGDQGFTGDQGPQGERGETGPKGDSGQDGKDVEGRIVCCKKVEKDGQQLAFFSIRCDDGETLDIVLPCADDADILIIKCDD